MGRGEQTQLVISVHFDGVNHTVLLEGELDLATAPRLESALKGLAPAGDGLVLLDLECLSFTDAVGLAAIERAAQALGGRLIVCGPRPSIRGILQLTHMDERVEIKDESAAEVSDIGGGNVAYIRQLWDAYEKGGPEQIVGLAEDVSWEPPGAAGSLRTVELLRFCDSRPGMRVIPEAIDAVGHDVLVTWRVENGSVGRMWSLCCFDERRLVKVVSFDNEPEAIAALRLFDRRSGRAER
jgi:anti-sigma B factor antagonist